MAGDVCERAHHGQRVHPLPRLVRPPGPHFKPSFLESRAKKKPILRCHHWDKWRGNEWRSPASHHFPASSSADMSHSESRKNGKAATSASAELPRCGNPHTGSAVTQGRRQSWARLHFNPTVCSYPSASTRPRDAIWSPRHTTSLASRNAGVPPATHMLATSQGVLSLDSRNEGSPPATQNARHVTRRHLTQ